jgi:2-phosphosulfolactate phosphatase
VTQGLDGARVLPEIRTLHLLDGALRAEGLAVIIDVFRAFTLAPCLFAGGAARVLAVATPDEALALKRAHPDWLLAGERDGRPLPGFDLPNSPARALAEDFSGRTVVLRTSAGVQGLLAARGAAAVITGSFANAAAVAAYARRHRLVSLVCMGWNASEVTADDTECAAYLEAGIRGRFPPLDPIRARLRADPSGAKFFDPARPWFPEADFEVCTSPPRFDFVLRARYDAGGPVELERLSDADAGARGGYSGAGSASDPP